MWKTPATPWRGGLKYYMILEKEVENMKKMHRVLSALLVLLTMVAILGVLPGEVFAAGVKAPVVTASNDAETGKIALTWDAVSGAAKYEIYRATSKSGTYSRRSTVTGTTYTNTNAVAGKTYYYKVRAIAKDGAYAESKVVSRTCDLPCPVVSATNTASTGYPKLTWEAVEGAKEYKVYRATSKSGDYSLTKTTTSTSYTNSTAKVGKTYYYKVMAVAENSAANSAYSAVKSRTCDLPRPVVTASNVTSTGYPKLTWGAVEGAKEYKVYRATSEDGAYSLTKTTASTSYTNTSAKPGNVYYYKVMAVAENSAANSAYSSVKSRTCDLAQPKVAIALNDDGQPTLTWDAVSGAKSYKVYRADSADGAYSLMKTTTDTSYTNASAEDGNTYCYKVRAICENTDGNSAYSAIVSIKAGIEAPPAASSNLRYVNLTSVYVYKSPDSSTESLRLFYMVEVELGDVVKSGSSGKWQEVYYKGDLYYIWLTPDSDKLTDRQSTMEYTVSNSYQEEIRDLALKIYREWDAKYVSGAVGDVYSDGTVGFDCSGFSCYVINTVMQRYVPAYRLSTELGGLWSNNDIYNTGLKGEFKAIDVELKDAQLGDIIFFKSATTGQLNHCGLYMGNNEFIHCTSVWENGENTTGTDVGLMTLNDTYGDLVLGVKRFIPETVEPADATFYAVQGCPIYADLMGTEKTDLRLTRGEAITVLYTRATTSNRIAYIRTADNKYGFVWMSNLSSSK